jgi:DNA repair exonuclease SbcCD ATPase subunit
MAIQFLNLSLRNFMAYGNNTTNIDLPNAGTTLIIGENGIGKTAIINALTYAVYGKPISSINLDNLVNNINKSQMEVSVTFEKDGIYYRIVRSRRAKNYASGNYVKFYAKKGSSHFTDKDERTRDSIVNTNSEIEEVIGISHELFCRIVVFSALHLPFLDLPVRNSSNACQVRIIEELLGLTSLTKKAEILKKQINNNKTELRIKQAHVEQLEGEHARHQSQLNSAKLRVTNWQEKNKAEISILEEKLKKIAGIDIDAQQEAQSTLVELQTEINRLKPEQREISNTINQLKRDITKKENELEHLRDKKCPYCLQKYQNADRKIKEVDTEIKDKGNKAAECSKSLKELEQEENEILKYIKTVKCKITVPNIAELVKIKSQSSTIAGNIERLKNAVNPFVEQVEELKAIKLDPIKKDEVNNLVTEIEHQEFLYKLLTKKDSFIRKALLNKHIPYLNSKLQQYIKELKLPHTVEFTHELTVDISQFGNKLSFGNLSNGQRARVNIALSLAFRDMLQQLHTKINVCMLDEVLDVGLDTTGISSAITMLKRKAMEEKLALYIISHRDDISTQFDHCMIIQMVNGFSSITA